MPRKIIRKGPSILNIPTKGSYRQIIKSLPVAASKNRKSQVDNRNKSQGLSDPAGNGNGIDHQQVLDGPQGTGRSAEGSAKEQGKQQGKQEEQQCCQ